jgi:hypothetical protein
LAFAIGNVLQQRGTLQTSTGIGYTGFVFQLLRTPVWVAGLLIQISGWLLDNGPLVVVQSICALSIVLAFPFGARLTAQRITTQVVVGASFTVVGIILFLVVGAPGSGTSYPSGQDWWVAGVWTLVAAGSCAVLGRLWVDAPRALFLGAAAGFCFAMQAALTKQLVEELGRGASAVFAHWPIYALAATALIGFVLWQLALKADVLAPAMASSNAATLFAGVLLGITLYGETLRHNDVALGFALMGLGLALLGVVLLSTAPPPARSRQAIESCPGSSGS